MAHDAQEHTIYTNGSFDDVWCVAFVCLRIEVFNLFAAEFGVLGKVEVRTAVNALHFLEAEWHFEFNVGSGVGIVSQLVVIVKTIVLCPKS